MIFLTQQGIQTMKLNVTYENKNEISGYQNINIEDAASLSSLSETPDYSCKDIILNESFNLIDKTQALQLLTTLCQKLSINGKITINVIDFESLCIDFINGHDNPQTTNDLVAKIKHVSKIEDLVNLMNSYNISISSIHYANYMAHIHGEKIVNEQNNTII